MFLAFLITAIIAAIALAVWYADKHAAESVDDWRSRVEDIGAFTAALTNIERRNALMTPPVVITALAVKPRRLNRSIGPYFKRHTTGHVSDHRKQDRIKERRAELAAKRTADRLEQARFMAAFSLTKADYQPHELA